MTKFDRVLTKVDCPNSIGVFDMGQMGQFKIKSSAFIVWKKTVESSGQDRLKTPSFDPFVNVSDWGL